MEKGVKGFGGRDIKGIWGGAGGLGKINLQGSKLRKASPRAGNHA